MTFKLKKIQIILAAFLLLSNFALYKFLSHPYKPGSFLGEKPLKKDSLINPKINQFINLPLPLLEDIAYQGNAQVQYIVGMKYQFGVGTFPDYHRAKLWYERSAKGGDPAGMYWFSKINSKLIVDIEKELIEKSAELGYWRAIRELQLIDLSREFANASKSILNSNIKIDYDNNQDFDLIYRKAKFLYNKKLKNLVGSRLLNGFKIETADDGIMLQLFKTAALGGNGNAQQWLGQFYKKTDAEQSERWIVHSAFNGNKEAFQDLAFLQSKKFFTKERIDLGEKLDLADDFNYYQPEGLMENKKHYARVAYFWNKMAEDNGFDFDLWFYERWPIDRIFRECRNFSNFTEECNEKYAFGVLFGETYAKSLMDKY